MEKNSKAERARQFMPFAALRGFDAMLREEVRERIPRKELSEYDAERLSRKISTVEKGDLVRVKYYDRDAYVVLEGIVSDLDIPMRRIRVIKTVISLDDISDMVRLESGEHE